MSEARADNPKALYDEIFELLNSRYDRVASSKMFGVPTLKVKGKAFASLFEDEMVFKLTGSAHKAALRLSDAKPFDPSGKQRPMKEWVQVPFAHADKWEVLAESALKYVATGN